MKSVDEPALPAQVPLAFMQQIPMYEHQRSRLDLPQLVLFLTFLPI